MQKSQSLLSLPLPLFLGVEPDVPDTMWCFIRYQHLQSPGDSPLDMPVGYYLGINWGRKTHPLWMAPLLGPWTAEANKLSAVFISPFPPDLRCDITSCSQLLLTWFLHHEGLFPCTLSQNKLNPSLSCFCPSSLSHQQMSTGPHTGLFVFF